MRRNGDEGAAVPADDRHYREFRPPPDLARHIRCLWTHRCPPGPASPVTVLPDGCVDLLWMGGRLVVAGPDETAAVATPAPGETVTGVRFRPGAALPWLGLPMAAIVGQRVPLGDLWGEARAGGLADRLGEAPTPAERLRRLAEGLGRLAPAMAPPAPDMAALFALLDRPPPGTGLAAVCDRLAASERSLRRRCHAAFGYGPKTLDRILRFQRFLWLARAPGGRALAALAADAGYADQAHLSREVRRLSGRTPARLLRPDGTA